MHFARISTLLIALSGGAIAASCSYENKEGIASSYYISASGVDDIPGICGGLWDNLHQFPDCIGVGSASCGPDSSGNLDWQFTNGGSCNPGMVAATWWDATKNKFGSIDCGG